MSMPAPGAAPFSPNQVSQIHSMSDVDSSARAQHHTLGSGPYQAAPGNVVQDLQTTVATLNTSSGSQAAAISTLQSEHAALQAELTGTLSVKNVTATGEVTSSVGFYDSALPLPVSVSSAGSATANTATVVDTAQTSISTVSLTLARACLVQIGYGCWFEAIAAADCRAGVTVLQGSTVVNSAGTSTTSTIPGPSYGATLYCGISTITVEGWAQKTLQMPAGTYTFQFSVWRNAASGTGTIAFPTMTITPLRWLA